MKGSEWFVAGALFVIGFVLIAHGIHGLSQPAAPSPPDIAAGRWKAEADVLDLLLSAREEPYGALNCYPRGDHFECLVRDHARPSRWATCRPRRAEEHGDDGRRCAWIAREVVR